MARLAAVEKALYYPTPIRALELLFEKHITVEGTCANWGSVFDPCAGTGEAVAYVRDALERKGIEYLREHPPSHYEKQHARPEWGWIAKGVELDEHRAEAAKKRLGSKNVIHGALEQILKPPHRSGMFDTLFLNPPYDDVGGKREELRFLRMASSFLSPGGLAILVLPNRFVADGVDRDKLVGTLKSRSLTSDLRVYQFPEPEYQLFKQVIVTVKKGHGTSHYMPNKELEVTCVLGEWQGTGNEYTDSQAKIRVQRAGWPNNEKQDTPPIMKRDGDPPVPSIFSNGVEALDQLTPFLGDPATGTMDMRPLMSMGQEHGAMVAASGALNGMELDTEDGRRLLIRGSDYKTTVTAQETEILPDGREVQITRETEKIVSRLALLDLTTGDIELADSQYQKERYEDLLLTHADTFVKVAEKLYPPIVTPEIFAEWEKKLADIKAPSTLTWHDNGMFEAQAWRGAAILQCWREKQVAILDGEMSTGKTLISLAAAAIAALRRRPGNRHIIVILPPKDDLLAKWAQEAKKALAHFNPRVFQIGIKSYPRPNGAKGKTKMPIMELEEAFAEQDLTVILMKSTTAKLASGIEDIPLPTRKNYRVMGSSSTWRTVPSQYGMEQDNPDSELVWVNERGISWDEAGALTAEALGKWKIIMVTKYEVCPRCYEDPRGDWNETDEEEPELKTGRARKCRVCGEGLWARCRDKHKNARFPLARYIREYFSSRYILIIDEAHETKAADSAISYAASDLVYASYKSVMMTGTLFGGKASSIFFLLYRAVPEFRHLYKFDDVQKFIDDYGLWERITKRYQRMYKGTLQSGYKTFKQSPTERPGVAPGMVMLLLPVAAYISLDDLGHAMPEYAEHTLFIDADKKLFRSVQSFLGAAASAAAAASREEPRDARPMAQYRQARLGVTNLPFGPDSVGEGTSIEPVFYKPPDYPKEHLFLKEEALVRLCWQEKQAGRKVLCFVSQIHRRDPTPRLIDQLAKYGIHGTKLEAKIKKRVPWLTRTCKTHDIIFLSPDIVSVGVDLHMFHTAIWYSPHYNMYIVPQANRRLYRLQQDQDVNIYYLAYNELPEAPAFAYIAEKMAAQQALRGDIRAGLARLLGEETFVQKLQDAVVGEIPQLDSDLIMDDLPALPTAEELATTEFESVQKQLKAVRPLQQKRFDRKSWLDAAREFQKAKKKRKKGRTAKIIQGAALFAQDGNGQWDYTTSSVIIVEQDSGDKVSQGTLF